MIDTDKIVEIANYFTPVHHIKGRLRVRVNPAIVKESKDISLQDIKDLPNKIEGLKEIRINKLAATVVITYDNKVFPYELWEDLLHGRNLEEIKELLASLERKLT